MPIFAQHVHAETRVFFGSAEFEVELTSRSSELTGMDRLSTNAETIVLANEVSSLPGANTGVGDTLTFAATSTGLSRDYILRTSEDNARFTFDDDEEDGNMVNFDDALSVGDINNSEDDDWSLTISEPIRAVGFHLYDNIFDGSETLTFHDGGTLLETIPLPSGNSVSQFIGVITDFDFTEIRFNEGAGDDDIAIANFKFPADSVDYSNQNFYGNKLAMDASGNTLAVAAMGANDAGMVLVHDRNLGGADNWGIIAKLTAPDGADYDRFGWAIDISADGNTIVVGAPFHNTDDTRNTGAVYVYNRNQGSENNWGLVKKLIPEYIDEANDNFGFDVEIDDAGLLMIIGSPGEERGNANGGIVYVLARNTGGTNNWGQSDVYSRSGTDGDDCGRSVAISGDGKVRAFGCPLFETEVNSTEKDNGNFFVYGKAVTQTGRYQFKERLGVKASLNYDGTVFATSSAANGVEVYSRASTDDNFLSSSKKFLGVNNDDSSLGNAGDIWRTAAGDIQLSLAGDKLIAGDPFNDENDDYAGMAHYYDSDNGFMDNRRRVRMAFGQQDDVWGFFDRNFGYGVTMSADASLVAIGAPKVTRDLSENGSSSKTGVVYLFDQANLTGPEGITRTLSNGVILSEAPLCFPIKAKNGNIALVCL